MFLCLKRYALLPLESKNQRITLIKKPRIIAYIFKCSSIADSDRIEFVEPYSDPDLGRLDPDWEGQIRIGKARSGLGRPPRPLKQERIKKYQFEKSCMMKKNSAVYFSV